MLKEGSEKKGVSIEGTLVCPVGDIPNIFEESQAVKEAEEALDALRTNLSKVRQQKILPVFREEIAAFKRKFGRLPDRVVMSNYERNLLTMAVNDEVAELLKADIIPLNQHQPTWGDDKDRLIDGVLVASGCTTRRTSFRMYLYEVPNGEVGQ